MERLLRWRAFPAVFQWPLLGLVALVAYLALRPVHHAELNPGAAIVWQLWWAFLPFFILLTARLWCAICPFPALGDAAQRLSPLPLPLPPSRVRRAGPWLATIALALLGFVFLLLSLEGNGPLTAVLLLVFAVGAVGTSLLWRGRAFCRYLCPLGLMAGLYSRLAWLRLGPYGDHKGQAAMAARRCPLFTSPIASRRAQDCTLCAACLHGEGGEAVTVRLQRPSLAGPALSTAEAMAITLLLGFLLADALRMTPLYLRYMARATPLLGGDYQTAMASGVAGTVILLLLGQAVLALIMGRMRRAEGPGKTGGFWPVFARLSLVWLPLALATHLALSAQHLLAVDIVARNLGAELALFAPGHMPPADAYSFVWAMKGLQWATLAVGLGAALYLAGRTGQDRGPSLLVGAALPAMALGAIFWEPMSVAC